MIENDARSTYIKELIDGRSRKELDEIARALSLNPTDYMNKRELAKGILANREKIEKAIGMAATKTAPTEEAHEVEEMSMSSVRGMIRAAEEKASGFKAFYAGEFHQGMQVFQKALESFKRSIEEQRKENDDFIKNDFGQILKKFRQSIMDQARENQKFIKQFYG